MSRGGHPTTRHHITVWPSKNFCKGLQEGKTFSFFFLLLFLFLADAVQRAWSFQYQTTVHGKGRVPRLLTSLESQNSSKSAITSPKPLPACKTSVELKTDVRLSCSSSVWNCMWPFQTVKNILAELTNWLSTQFGFPAPAEFFTQVKSRGWSSWHCYLTVMKHFCTSLPYFNTETS